MAHPKNNRSHGDDEPYIPPPVDSHRPPNLNPTCRDHGGLGCDHCNGEGGDGGNSNNSDADVTVRTTNTTPAMSDTSDTSSISGESIDGEEGVENEVEVGDLGRYTRQAIRRAPVSVIFRHCPCGCRECICRLQGCASQDGASCTVIATPSPTRMTTPLDTEITEASSVESVYTLSRATSWASNTQILAGILDGTEARFFGRGLPPNFVRKPMELTATPEYLYPTKMDDSDFYF